MKQPFIFYVNNQLGRYKLNIVEEYINLVNTFSTDQISHLEPRVMDIRTYSDGEFGISFPESVRKQTVCLVGSTLDSDSIVKLMLAVDAAKRADASEIIALIPYFGYARQDRKDGLRGSIGAKAISNALVSNGVSKIVSIDLHATQVQGFTDTPFDNIYGYDVLKEHILKQIVENDNDVVFVSPDAGGAKRARVFVDRTNQYGITAEFGMCDKYRERANEVSDMKYIGADVRDKDVYLIDDMCDTAGTVCTASEILHKMGARAVYPVFTHAVLSGPAFGRLRVAMTHEHITSIITTNTHNVSKLAEDSRYSVVDVSRSLAISIYAQEYADSNARINQMFDNSLKLSLTEA